MNSVNADGGPKDAKTSVNRSGFNEGGNWSQPGSGDQKGSTPQGGVSHSTNKKTGLKADSPLQTGTGSLTEYAQKSPMIPKGGHIRH